jgi:hypothetical protein
MDRDRRLTGYLRGQTDNPTAPPGFELNNAWRVSILSGPFDSAESSADIIGSVKNGSSRLAGRFPLLYISRKKSRDEKQYTSESQLLMGIFAVSHQLVRFSLLVSKTRSLAQFMPEPWALGMKFVLRQHP